MGNSALDCRLLSFEEAFEEAVEAAVEAAALSCPLPTPRADACDDMRALDSGAEF